MQNFREKQITDGALINAGYMVLEPQIFDYLDNDSTVFEQEPMNRLVALRQLMSYKHTGFWQCLDTKREQDILEKLWNSGNAPWKIW